jgi:hypothetical protein
MGHSGPANSSLATPPLRTAKARRPSAKPASTGLRRGLAQGNRAGPQAPVSCRSLLASERPTPHRSAVMLNRDAPVELPAAELGREDAALIASPERGPGVRIVTPETTTLAAQRERVLLASLLAQEHSASAQGSCSQRLAAVTLASAITARLERGQRCAAAWRRRRRHTRYRSNRSSPAARIRLMKLVLFRRGALRHGSARCAPPRPLWGSGRGRRRSHASIRAWLRRRHNLLERPHSVCERVVSVIARGSLSEKRRLRYVNVRPLACGLTSDPERVCSTRPAGLLRSTAPREA